MQIYIFVLKNHENQDNIEELNEIWTILAMGKDTTNKQTNK